MSVQFLSTGRALTLTGEPAERTWVYKYAILKPKKIKRPKDFASLISARNNTSTSFGVSLAP